MINIRIKAHGYKHHLQFNSQNILLTFGQDVYNGRSMTLAIISLFLDVLFRAERQLQVLENLISALNVFLWSVAMNRRRRVCSLGEELLPSILSVWSEMRPSASLKEEMVAFFNTQLSVHHPKGAKTLETGEEPAPCHRLKDFIITEMNRTSNKLPDIQRNVIL